MLKTANIDELENKKISKLLWQYALPAIVGTMVNALYNIIDRIYIGHGPNLGDHAIGGLGIVLPIMNLTAAVGMLVGAGSASRISICLGRGDKETAEKIIGNSFLMTILLTGTLVTLLFIFLDPILMRIGATEETFPFAKEFLLYYLPGNIFLTMCFNFNSMMRASGYPAKAMYTMLIGVVANIIIAPVFIFVLEWGIKGAAIATIISMFIGLCFVMYHFMNQNSMLRLRKKNIGLNPKVVWAVASIGMSPFFIQVAASVVVFFINNKLKTYGGNIAIEAYAIANTLVMIIIMVMVGLTQGMQPIVGYNYGAKRIARVKETLFYTIKVGMVVGCVGLVIGLLLPELIVKPFNPSPPLAAETAKALKIITIMLPFVGYQIVVTNFFQCIGMAGKSIFLSLTRQFLMLLPALFILPKFFGINGVWVSLPTADFVATVLTAVLFYLQVRSFRKMEAMDGNMNPIS
ncbi:putative MATE family efflux protein [Dysgonomonas hofstadii]|uniref:Multidrug export protein MepA n=1 Tax=Dysgonomonas hofstadii TaxID=637886 RepID=A0A840CU12_9BACT|nr:MATE family efflux transporter [Dysgonomonas hofstadii]MBB4037688.1 putative MATE family efflux protein [Dysgonomonas hofstadii]